MLYSSIEGSGERWVVLVHGLTCDASDWDLQVAALRSSCRCLRVDLRGHGRSSHLPGPYDMVNLAADVVASMRENGVVDAVLVGHSMGTRVILNTAIAAPDLVSGLVFVDGSRQGTGEAEAARAAAMKAFDDKGYEAQLRAMFEMMFTSDEPTELRTRIIDRALAMPEAVGRELVASMAVWDAAHMESALRSLSDLGIPLKVVQSTTVDSNRMRRSFEDGENDSAYLSLLRERVVGAQIEVVPQIGHFTQFEAAELTNTAILEWVERAR